jgi:hypothetical protein
MKTEPVFNEEVIPASEYDAVAAQLDEAKAENARLAQVVDELTDRAERAEDRSGAALKVIELRKERDALAAQLGADTDALRPN